MYLTLTFLHAPDEMENQQVHACTRIENHCKIFQLGSNQCWASYLESYLIQRIVTVPSQEVTLLPNTGSNVEIRFEQLVCSRKNQRVRGDI